VTALAVAALIVAALSTWGNLYYFDSMSKITTYYEQHSTQALLSQFFFLLWGVAIVILAAGLRPVLRAAGRGESDLSSLAFGLALLILGWMMVFAAVNGGLASAAAQASPGAVKLVMGVEGEVDLLTFLAVGLFIGTTSVAMVRAKVFARWIGWLGLASGVLFLVSEVSFLDPNPNGAVASLGNVGMGGLLLFLIWALAVGVSLLRGTRHRTEPSVTQVEAAAV
jgi:hypothetical protein